MEFDQNAQEKMLFYVYGLFDPDKPRWPFYIGKGRRNRVFDHARGVPEVDDDHAQLSQKLSLINDIRSSGRSVVHKILRFGLTSEEALKIEASLIDLVNYMEPDSLTNEISGQGVAEGFYDARDLALSLAAQPLAVSEHRLLVIKIERRWSSLVDKYGNAAAISENDIFHATKGEWKLSIARAQKVDCVVSVARGLVRGVFVPAGWEDAGYEDRKRMTGLEDSAAFFHLKNTSVAHLFSRGSQNPIRYLP